MTYMRKLQAVPIRDPLPTDDGYMLIGFAVDWLHDSAPWGVPIYAPPDDIPPLAIWHTQIRAPHDPDET